MTRSWLIRAYGNGADMFREQRHRLELLCAGGLVDDHLQPPQLALDERARQDVETRRVDGRFDHGVPRPVEADEFATDPAVHDRHVDSRSRRRAVDRANLDFPPGAAV